MVQENKTADNTIRRIVLAGELLALNAALLMMSLLYESLTGQVTPHYKRLMLLMSLVYVACEMRSGGKIHHRFVRNDEILRNLISGLLSFIALSLLIMWVFRWPLLTWQFMLPFYGFIVVFVSVYRWAMRQVIRFYRRRGRNTMRVLFVGNINIASDLYRSMKDDPSTGYRVVGYFADHPRPNVTADGYLGTPDEAIAFVEREGATLHNVFCMLPSSDNDTINRLISTCEQSMVRYHHIPDSFNYQRHTMALELMANTPVLAMHYEPLSSLGNRILKRSFDIVFSLLFLLLVFPWVYLVFGWLIKRSSPGPVFFRQKRSGIEGRNFDMLKFRSMRVNADQDRVQATKDDPRKTRIGEFMRRTSIDELPQFINVLKGDMSVVGPRPHMVRHTEQYSELIGNYMVRHYAKPGITGWAQVTGSRGETRELHDMEERIEKDIWYIEHWSFLLDIFIIWKTIVNALRGEEKAY
ncbi:MAG: undecaprenyl-phosphate glucose phosphotransferase [Bacteroidales bacterium]|nr:undecaprenyl-phosphate glucose phosphotransferase [Candidatus Physcousia equi]